MTTGRQLRSHLCMFLIAVLAGVALGQVVVVGVPPRPDVGPASPVPPSRPWTPTPPPSPPGP